MPFQKLKRKILKDSRVTNNLNSIKKLLQKSNVDDQVIIIYSGHGIRKQTDGDSQLYLATTETNQLNPEEKGISIHDFEALVDDIPARNKLMIVDACFSGEWDEDPAGFALMKSLFVDLRRGSGTTIVTSASSTQRAEAGGDLGEFTALGKSLLAGLGFLDEEAISPLKPVDAWTGVESSISISLLMDYLEYGLFALSKGRHELAFRAENIANDWLVI